MNPVNISKQTARRYVLGRQGLWPGRRWRGKEGVARAIEQIEAVQIDTIVVVARNHDIVLWSRVDGYDPAQLDSLLYTDRLFFDYGGILMVYPMRELPYWRPIMRRQAEQNSFAGIALDNPEIIASIRQALRERGPQGSREFTGRAVAESGRAGNETGLVLRYLWSTGELMTYSRRNFDRVYHFRDEIAPAEFNHEATMEEAEAYFARKALFDTGLCTARNWADRLAVTLHRRAGPAEVKRFLANMTADGTAATARVEGSAETWYFPAREMDILTALQAGSLPAGWAPLGTTTQEEATLIAPLDNVTWDRARLRAIFDYDYIWEVYKPAAQRRWGYYTVPVLYGDRFVARLDPKLDRAGGTLHILGFWLDEPALAEDRGFALALAKCLDRFAAFLGARHIDAGVLPGGLAT